MQHWTHRSTRCFVELSPWDCTLEMRNKINLKPKTLIDSKKLTVFHQRYPYLWRIITRRYILFLLSLELKSLDMYLKNTSEFLEPHRIRFFNDPVFEKIFRVALRKGERLIDLKHLKIVRFSFSSSDFTVTNLLCKVSLSIPNFCLISSFGMACKASLIVAFIYKWNLQFLVFLPIFPWIRRKIVCSLPQSNKILMQKWICPIV